MPSKPRHLLNGRDMAYSIIPLVLVCLVLAGASRACSFSPQGPTAGPVPTVDVGSSLTSFARDVDFPVRVPGLPEGWQANSSDRRTVDGATGGESVRAGWIPPNGSYLRLAQSSAAEGPLLASEVSSRRSPTATVDLAGATWTVYTQEGSEPAWVTDLGDVRLSITGSGLDQDFRTLAVATTTAPPIDTTS